MAEKKYKATRDSYGEMLAELGAENERVVVFDADLAASTKTSVFAKKFPKRFFDCGIAEANMMSIAAGASTTGLIPFASTFAMFAAGRAFEQVRNSIGYPHLNVKIAATHAGLSVGEDGASHQCNEDIATMRVIPGMTVICPADDVETRAAIRAAADYVGPVYLRFGRMAVPCIYETENYSFEIGKGIRLTDGEDVTIIATGLMVSRAIEAAQLLGQRNISARVLDFHTIKPIDRSMIEKAAKETGAIVTAEEHSVIGGLGSAVSEVVAETAPVPILRVGVQDVFGESGSGNEVLLKYGLSAKSIVEAVEKVMELKRANKG
ncbi:MAG: transketolase family protein [Oscillospiraceae bacterium]|nr:transketolase family protein [Oscillospiraceae bacterium]